MRLVLIAILGVTAKVGAQDHQALQLTGVVVDATDAVLPGATVELTGSAGASQTNTDARGHFSFDSVPSGTYQVRVSLEGFRTRTVSVTLNAAQAKKPLDIALDIAEVHQEITVNGAESAVTNNPGSNADAVTIDQNALDVLPVFNNDVVETMSREAGVALSELRVVPGVEAVGAGAPLPLSGRQGLLRFGLRIEGRPDPPDGRADRVYLRWATPDYFHAMGIPVRQGRTFAESDRAETVPVAIIDETLAARDFPGENPIGKRVRASNDRIWRQIVGIVGGVRQTRLEEPAEPHLYVAEAQSPSPELTFVVRTVGEPQAVTSAVRETLRRIDPALPVFNVRTLEEVVSGAVAPRRTDKRGGGLLAGSRSRQSRRHSGRLPGFGPSLVAANAQNR